MGNEKILIVEDEVHSAARLEACLKCLGYRVCAAVSSGREAVEKAGQTGPGLALVSLELEGEVNGPETATHVRSRFDVPVVFLTDKADEVLLRRAQETHPFGYVLRTFDDRQLHLEICSALSLYERERRHKEARARLEAHAELMETILDCMSEAVLVLGENGEPLIFNASSQQMLGVRALEGDMKEWGIKYGVHRSVGDRFLPMLPTISEDENIVELALRGKATEGMELFIRNEQRPDGIYLRTNVRPLEGKGDAPNGAVIVSRDITREVEAEKMKSEVLRLRAELEKVSPFSDIVGGSPGMREVYALMEQASEGDITVLIQGETGTGKELVARSIHSHSGRKQGPFLAVDCAAVPETLIESELFGHERGAFTGATERRIGSFELADGGTILLDEIGDMPYALQAKLLRVLQEREIRRVGGTAPIPIDIRVVAATNKDLDREVRNGKFREDLLYRVSAFPIDIPPLRERRDDIPLLARHFIEGHTRRIGKSISAISTVALRVMREYDWPGNVRELENVIERAVLLEQTSELQAANLPFQLSPIASIKSRSKSGPLPLVEVERQALTLALEFTGNNVPQAALALGIDPTTLRRKLKRFAISID